MIFVRVDRATNNEVLNRRQRGVGRHAAEKFFRHRQHFHMRNEIVALLLAQFVAHRVARRITWKNQRPRELGRVPHDAVVKADDNRRIGYGDGNE